MWFTATLQVGVPELVVFLNKIDLLAEGDAELKELVEMEVRCLSLIVCLLLKWRGGGRRREKTAGGKKGRLLGCLEEKRIRRIRVSGGQKRKVEGLVARSSAENPIQ